MSAYPGRLVLLGHPVAHSLSPAFQNAALERAEIPLRYEALDVEPTDLAVTFARLVAERAAGNVTVPHKEAIARLCGSLTPEADRVGAVNTFAVRDSEAVGHNTDVAGFTHSATALLGGQPSGVTVGVFGAGGAAAAVLAAIESWAGCTAIVVNRNASRAKTLCERFRTIARAGDAEDIAEHANIIVNATSLGMRRGETGPIDPDRLRHATAVLDLVYSPTETDFVHAARARGLRATDGLPMLLSQGAAAFTWWFGRVPDVEVMWRAVGRSPRTLD